MKFSVFLFNPTSFRLLPQDTALFLTTVSKKPTVSVLNEMEAAKDHEYNQSKTINRRMEIEILWLKLG
jgi:hypothetical protein